MSINKEILNLLTLQTGASWVKEVTEKILSKEFMSTYGLTGSPKLTKQLVKLGLSEQQVSLAMSPTQTDYKVWTGFDSDVIVRLQGNSKAFKSCQRVTDPNDLKCWKGADLKNCQITKDVAPYICGNLQFITFGNPITEDGVGWLARAKVRVIYSNYEYTNRKVAGYLLDRPYGDTSLLLSAFIDAYKDKGQLYISNYYGLPVANLPDQHNLEAPSSSDGYQDSPCWYDNVHMYKPKPLTLTAYQSRIKEGNIYVCAVKDVVYNSQKCEFIQQPKTTDRSKIRGFKKTLEFKQIVKLFGLDWKLLKDDSNSPVKVSIHEYYVTASCIYTKSMQEAVSYEKGCLKPPCLTVKKNVPELGFYTGSRLWYECTKTSLQVYLRVTYSGGKSWSMENTGDIKQYDTLDTYWDENPGGIAQAMELELNTSYISKTVTNN